jgi:hypothetical protein
MKEPKDGPGNSRLESTLSVPGSGALKAKEVERRQNPELPHQGITAEVSINDINGPILDLAEEDIQEPEVELDPSTDPIINTLTYPSLEWEEQIRKIEVRRPNIPSPESQKERVEWVLNVLESEKLEPDPEQIEESLRWLSELESLIPDYNRFVACNFHHF